MANTIAGRTLPISSQGLLGLSTRLTIGNGVCITEGLFASIMVLVPRDHWFYFIGAMLSLAVWCAFWRFRSTKLGADICDLSFWDFIAHSALPLALYLAKIDPTFLFYIWTAFSALKITRVYIWQASETQRHGWYTFGPMTWHYAKHYANPGDAAGPSQRLFIEIGVALILAVLVSVGIKQLDDLERVIVVWVVPLTFEFVYGPIQLRSLAAIGKNAFSSEQREAEKDAENERLKQEVAQAKTALEAAKREVELLRNMQNAPSADHMALIEAYEATKPERKSQLVKIAQNVAEAFSTKGKPKQ